jgi:hypothetical protein
MGFDLEFTADGLAQPKRVTVANPLPIGGGAAQGAPITGQPVIIAGAGADNASVERARLFAPFDQAAADTKSLVCWSSFSAIVGTNLMSRVRTPATFKTASATASGDTAVWTPASGKKFRLMRFKLQVTANAYLAARGVLTITLRDGTTDLNLTHDVYLGQTAIAADTNPQQTPLLETHWIDLGNGVLSASANQVLNINLSAALSGGNVRVIACGTEE